MSHKVFITTSGIGSRLGDLTKYTNKSLVRVGSKPAIAHILESYPTGTHFVVTLGHFGDQVRDFLTLAYPDRAIEYVTVPKYEGPGTSLGLSMLAAKDALQCPFIYHAGDTLITEVVPVPDKNWVGVYKGSDTSQYASWTVQEGKLQFHEKGAIDADFIHIGLIGVHDYATFWDALTRLHTAAPENTTLNDCQTLCEMINTGIEMNIVEFPVWHDIGNVDALQAARAAAGTFPDDLGKANEAVFIFDTFVIKFFSDKEIVKNRAERGKALAGFVPNVEGVAGNFYRYQYVEGELYSHVVQPNDFRKFLAWAEESFWKEEKGDETAFHNACRTFYEEKTKKRIAQFFETSQLSDTTHTINGEAVPSLAEMLSQVDFEQLSKGLPSRFHGDFILDNILKTRDGYCLIDWRQDFGGLLSMGDRYYDLAKMNHNLTVNHRIINRELYTASSDGTTIHCEIMRPSPLVDCQAVFFDFLKMHGYDARRVRLLTALIWLNMAPLHHHPFNHFLYYFGKLNLWRALNEKSVS